METSWLYAWAVAAATAFKAPSPDFATMVLLLALGALCGRLSCFVPWRHPRGHLLLVPATLAVLPIWLHAALRLPGGWGPTSWSALIFARNGTTDAALVGAGVLALYLWGRGVWIGVRPPSTRTLGKWLVGGAAAFIALFALLAAGHDQGVAPIAGRLELLVLGYFILGLSVIAIVHTSTVRDRTSAGQPISLSWFIALAIPAAAIAALGVLFSGDLEPVMRAILAPAAHTVLRNAASAGQILEKAVLWTGHAVGSGLLMFLRWLSHLFPVGMQQVARRGPESLLPPPPLLHRPPLFHPASVEPNPLFVYLVLGALLGLIAAGLTFLYLRFLFRRSASDSAGTIEEERTSLWSWQLFGDQLQGLWAALFGHFQKGRQALAGWPITVIAGRAGKPDPADIRDIYRRLLRWAAARGHRRHPATTPHELCRQISAELPLAAAALALITANYERARYGDLEITGPALAASRAASDKITTRPVK